jgi:AraC-like DNA-binding protein
MLNNLAPTEVFGPPLAASTQTRNAVDEIEEGQPQLVELCASSHEELARLGQILDELGRAAIIRSVDGTILPLAPANESSDRALAPTDHCLSAPIYDAQGATLAFLELAADHSSDASKKLLLALIESTARAITERWFRICYHRNWIVAARRKHGPDTRIILAVDAEQKVVGADHHARRLLEAEGRRFAADLKLSALLQPGVAPFHGRRYFDLALTVLGSDDGAPWLVLITPPNLGAIESHRSERVLLHARPRLDTLTRFEIIPAAPEEQCGLPPRMLRRVQDYIDGHLDSTLNIEALADSLGLSVSHFGRCFRKSVGLTPHSYVMRRRLLRAQDLLAHTDLSLAEIALATGFADQSHFCRRFHQLVGMPPGTFRVRYR